MCLKCSGRGYVGSGTVVSGGDRPFQEPATCPICRGKKVAVRPADNEVYAFVPRVNLND
jgi:hypothetical protein